MYSYQIIVFILLAATNLTQALLPKVRNVQEVRSSADPPDVRALTKRGYGKPAEPCSECHEDEAGRLSIKCVSAHCCTTIGLNPNVPQVRFISVPGLI